MFVLPYKHKLSKAKDIKKDKSYNNNSELFYFSWFALLVAVWSLSGTFIVPIIKFPFPFPLRAKIYNKRLNI